VAGDFAERQPQIARAAGEHLVVEHLQRVLAADDRLVGRHEDGVLGVDAEDLRHVLIVERFHERLRTLANLRLILHSEFVDRLGAAARGRTHAHGDEEH
jgi:hypothetical protein